MLFTHARVYRVTMEIALSLPQKWSADSLLAVAFTQPGLPQPDAQKIWAQVLGDEPDAYQRAGTAITSSTSASGQREGYNLRIGSRLGRIEFLVAAIQTTEIERIDDVPAAARKLRDWYIRALSMINLVRIGIVVDCSRYVDANQAARELVEATGIALPEGSLDPLLQFNVRRPLTTEPSFQMNRLCTWSAGQMAYMPHQEEPKEEPFEISMQSFFGFKVDVNTVGNVLIPPGKAADIFIEHLDEAVSLIADWKSKIL